MLSKTQLLIIPFLKKWIRRMYKSILYDVCDNSFAANRKTNQRMQFPATFWHLRCDIFNGNLPIEVYKSCNFPMMVSAVGKFYSFDMYTCMTYRWKRCFNRRDFDNGASALCVRLFIIRLMRTMWYNLCDTIGNNGIRYKLQRVNAVCGT